MKKKISFKELNIPPSYGIPVRKIYVVFENHRSKVLEKLNELDRNMRDSIYDLISRMAVDMYYRSPKIKRSLKGYSFGEIRPMPNRLFYFQVCGRNLIFFDFVIKKKNAFKDSFYKELERKKRNYENEFRRTLQ